MRLTPEAPNAPLKQPQIAVSGKIVALAYGAGNVVYFARSEDGGKTFSKSIKVGEESRLALGRHRGPRIVFAGTSLVITAETHEAAGKGGDLLAWSSADGGKHWTSPVRVDDVPTSAREGLHGLRRGRRSRVGGMARPARKGHAAYGFAFRRMQERPGRKPACLCVARWPHLRVLSSDRLRRP